VRADFAFLPIPLREQGVGALWAAPGGIEMAKFRLHWHGHVLRGRQESGISIDAPPASRTGLDHRRRGYIPCGAFGWA
jgi:hypothetical protein